MMEDWVGYIFLASVNAIVSCIITYIFTRHLYEKFDKLTAKMKDEKKN